MAANWGGAGYPDDDAHLDIKPLLRLGAWGVGACAATAIAVVAAQSDIGGRRAGHAIASLTGTAKDQPSQVEKSEMLARADAEREAKRLAEAVRVLAGDRDRLAGRVAQLERNLDDLTGSVARVAAARPPAATAESAEAPPTVAAPQTAPVQAAPNNPPPVRPAPATAPMQVAPAHSAAPNVSTAVVPLDPPRAAPPVAIAVPPAMAAMTPLWREHAELPAIPPRNPASKAQEPQVPDATSLPPPAPVAVLQSYAAAATSSSAASTSSAAADDPVPGPALGRPGYAVDLGAAPNLAGLRALWQKVRIRQPVTLDNLQPMVNIRDGAKPGTTELHLIAGPLSDTTAVARTCAALMSVGIACQPAVFDGQRLPEVPRPRPGPATAPVPARPPV